MKQIELTDYQVFITKKARSNYLDLVKSKYDFYELIDNENGRMYELCLYTSKTPEPVYTPDGRYTVNMNGEWVLDLDTERFY